MATAEVLSPNDTEEEIPLNGASSSLSAIEEADRSHQIATARRYPRSITQFTKELSELACLSQPTAMAMIYSLPRANKQIVGPSIRFAEAVLACWGNARAGVEVIDVDRKEGVVTAEGRYYDCEKNVGIALRKRRRIVAKVINGDSIQVTGDAVSSIAFRDAILRSVPKALWEPIWEKAKKTAAGDAKSVQVIRDGLLQTFRTLGVTDVQVFNALSNDHTPITGPADLGADQILALQAWHNQLKNGDCSLEDIFGSPLDEEIEQLMTALQWSETKKRMSRESYKGRRPEHLEYLRGLSGGEAKKHTPVHEPTTQPAAAAEAASAKSEAAPKVEAAQEDKQRPQDQATHKAQPQQGAKRQSKPLW